MSQDSSYYAARANQERRMAMAATDPAARRTHLEMAVEYARRAGSQPDLVPDEMPEDQQRTA